MSETETRRRSRMFYAYDWPTLNLAEVHGCLDEDVETGDPIVCAACSRGGVSDAE